MKTFLKENIGFFSTIGVFFALFLVMCFYSCSMETDRKALVKSRVESDNRYNKEVSRQDGFSDIVANLNAAKKDSELLAAARKEMLERLHFLINPNPRRQNGPNEEYKAKLASTTLSLAAVHGRLLEFFDTYRLKLTKANIKINSLGADSGGEGLPFPDAAGQSQECFGFAEYQSRLPKFKDDEAAEKTHHKIYKQMIIIERLLNILIEVKKEEQSKPLALMGIKRERMEGEGTGQPREILDPKNLAFLLVEKPGKIETYAFEIEIEGHTDSLRKFIDKLKPPFIVSDIKISRPKNNEINNFNQDLPLPLDLAPNDNPTSVEIPIINDVKSTFVITIEHIMQTLASEDSAYQEAFLKKHYEEADEDAEVRQSSSQVALFLRQHIFNELTFKDADADTALNSKDMSSEAYDELIKSVYAKEDY